LEVKLLIRKIEEHLPFKKKEEERLMNKNGS
jgi:hypothetical protein